MLLQVCSLFVFFGFCSGSSLWSQGVVHYSIDAQHYDFHSQDIITSTLAKIEKEICVKFFAIPANYTMGDKDRTLLISNPQRVKTCGNLQHDYSMNVVLLPIGYQCLNEKDITKGVVDLLRASIKQASEILFITREFPAVSPAPKKDDPSRPSLLPPSDRNYINAHYNTECSKLSSKPNLGLVALRRVGEAPTDLSYERDIDEYYADKIWPLGIVMYKVIVDPNNKEGYKKYMNQHSNIEKAMSTIQAQTCIVFHEVKDDSKELEPNNYLEFNYNQDSSDKTTYGFKDGVQKINVTSFVEGAPGHSAHGLYQLLRTLGVPVMSNRFDRDNYITINWKFVEKGKEHLLERDPPAGWLRDVPYDFHSATHAPGNFACGSACRLGAQTVQPLQDHLWQRTMSMGHTTELSEADVQTIRRVYGKECAKRQLNDA